MNVSYLRGQFHLYVDIWRFPEIGLPPKLSILMAFSTINHPFGGTSMTMEPPKKPQFFGGPDPGVKSPCDLDLFSSPFSEAKVK